MTRKIYVGGVPLGGGAPVSIQSMTNTPTHDVDATLAQIRALAAAGRSVRVERAVPQRLRYRELVHFSEGGQM